MIDKLELLLALARERHFSRAAEASGVTQPTLSAAVKSLEDQFGLLIVERGSRFGGFTPEGERILEWARRIVGDAHAMRDDVTAMRHGLSGRLRLGVIPTALPALTQLTLALRDRSDTVSFSILSLSSDDIHVKLENLEIDAGVSYIGDEPIGSFDAIPFYEERYVLLTAKDFPLPKPPPVTWRDAGRLPLCLLTPDMQNRRLINRHLKDAGAAPKMTLESNSLMVLYAHVRTGRWASIIPVRLAETFDRIGGLEAVPLAGPPATHPVGLIVHRRKTHSPLVVALMEAVRKSRRIDLAPQSRV